MQIGLIDGEELFRGAQADNVLHAVMPVQLRRGERGIGLSEQPQGERSTLGRIWHGAAVFRDRALDGDALGGFLAAFSADERRAIVLRKHDREREKLGQEIRAEISEGISEIKRELGDAQKHARERFMLACDNLRGDQDKAKAAMRERWQVYNADRRAALAKAQSRTAHVARAQDMYRGRGRGLEPG